MVGDVRKGRMDNLRSSFLTFFFYRNGEEWSKMRVAFQQALALDNVRTLLPKSDEIILDFISRVNDPSMELSRTDFLPHLMNLSLECKNNIGIQ